MPVPEITSRTSAARAADGVVAAYVRGLADGSKRPRRGPLAATPVLAVSCARTIHRLPYAHGFSGIRRRPGAQRIAR